MTWAPRHTRSPKQGLSALSSSLLWASGTQVVVRRSLIAELVTVLQAGCGREAPVRTLIRGSPVMFALALAWVTDNAEVVDVVAVCAAIQRQVNLKDAYPGMRLLDSSTALHSPNAWPAGMPLESSVAPLVTTAHHRAQLLRL